MTRQSNRIGIEDIVYFDVTESPSAKATIVCQFIEDSHTLTEFASFFQWLSERLAEGDIEFCNLIYNKLKLNKSSCRLLAMWLLRTLS